MQQWFGEDKARKYIMQVWLWSNATVSRVSGGVMCDTWLYRVLIVAIFLSFMLENT